MSRIINQFPLMVNGEWRLAISVIDQQPIILENMNLIVDDKINTTEDGRIYKEFRVYETEGYEFCSYLPTDTNGTDYADWFLLKKDQSAAQAQADLLNANAAYAAALDTIENGIPQKEGA